MSGTGSYIVIDDLSQGPHEIQTISATDLAGNPMANYEYEWTTDYGPPELSSLTPIAAFPEEGPSATVNIDLLSAMNP